MTLDQEWETTSGLPLDGANVKVKDMEFGYNASIGAGVVCANFTFEVLDGDNEGAEIEQSFSVGKQGEPSRDSTRLDGAPKQFASRSNYGRLIDSVRALLDHPGEVIGSPKEAAGWLGTKWTVGTVPVETANPNNDEKKVKDAFIFTAYLGKDGKGAKGAAKATAKTTKQKAATKDADDDETETDDESDEHPGISDALWRKLVKSARAADSHDEWSDEALTIDGVDGNRAAERAVLSTKAGSVWAVAHGDEE